MEAPTDTPTMAHIGYRMRVRDRLKEKLPEILLEAGSVVFALLLAYGVDQWREARSHAEMAARARQTIVEELRANREELNGTYTRNASVLQDMHQQIAAFGKARVTGVRTNLHLSQLSAAAFQAAQSTQALQFVDFGWLVRVAKIYELQRTYTAAQELALGEVSMASGAISGGENPVRVLERINSRLSTLQQLGQGLLQAYDEGLK
jgi:hypothetical protein